MLPRFILIASLTLISAGSAKAAESGLECAFSLSSEYLNEKYKLFQSLPNPFSPPIEYTLAKNRLIEKTCLRYAHCFFDDTNGWAFRSAFASCVQERAKEG